MKRAQEVFKRYEKKYLITQEQFSGLATYLKPVMKMDQYGRHTISNIYFDTPDYDLIRTSIEGPVYKEKLRLRSYGPARPGDTVFLELKKKFEGIVYKRRIPMELTEAVQYLYYEKRPGFKHQILNELDWFCSRYPLKPAASISYDRVALFGLFDQELRMTFDFHIRCRDKALRLEQGPYGTAILDSNLILMEVKIPNAMPIWMSSAFSELQIFPVSFSKYGTYYKQHLIQNTCTKGGICCA